MKMKFTCEGDLMKKINKKRTFIIILIITIFLLSGYSFAKIIDQTIIKTNAEIAKPIFILEDSPIMDITTNQNIGTYSFKIKNYDNKDRLTDVKLKYFIEIFPKLDKCVTLKIFENNEELQLENQKTDYISLSKDQKEEKEYKIEIKYDEKLVLTDILENIKLKVHSEQEIV